jgi:hypothetical protein
MARLLLLAFVALAACSTTMRQSFDETAALFHDDLRWGRLPTAEGAVDPAIRTAFTQRHRPWGVTVHIMDVEVESMRANADRGTVRLRVMWTRGTDSTEIRESVIEEAWETAGSGWRLRNEAIIAGDAGLFGTPTAAVAPAAPPQG